MAIAEPLFETSLLPTVHARLRILMAIVPGLRDLPRAHLEELQSLLGHAENLIAQSMERLVPSEFEPDLRH